MVEGLGLMVEGRKILHNYFRTSNQNFVKTCVYASVGACLNELARKDYPQTNGTAMGTKTAV